jgi:hypothetical protein
MIGEHTWDGVMNGVNHAIGQLKATDKLEPAFGPGQYIISWAWFDDHIAAAKKKNAEKTPPAPASRPPVPQENVPWAQRHAASKARAAEVRKAAEAAVTRLTAAGIEVDSRLLNKSEVHHLSCIVGELPAEQVLLAAVDRWLNSGSARKKVRIWSNIGDAIRQEVADAERMAAANAAAA